MIARNFILRSIGIIHLLSFTACMTGPMRGGSGSSAVPIPDSYYRKQAAPSSYDVPSVEERDAVQNRALGVSLKKKIVVFNLWNDSRFPEGDFGKAAADELRKLLHQSEQVLIPFPEMQETLETTEYITGDKVRVAQLIRKGRDLGASVVVIGKVSKANYRVKGEDVGFLRKREAAAIAEVDLKVFDVAGAKELLAISRSGVAESSQMKFMQSSSNETNLKKLETMSQASRTAAAEMVESILGIVEKTTWEGRIARVSQSKIYLNSGKQSGLLVGDILRVVSQGNEIYDPKSGAYLGRSEGTLKGTLEIADFLSEDAAVATVHSGGQFTEGDLVRLY